MRRFHKNTCAALGAVVFMLGAAACGGGDPKSDPSPSPTVSTSPASSPSPTSDAWKAQYGPAQVKAYDAALARWNEYEQQSEPIWARGKATQAAASLFKEYFPSPAWQGEYRRLNSYEQSDVKVVGTPKVYWSKAKSVAGNGLSVEILQCVDFSDVKVTQAGKPAKTSKWTTTPHLRALSLSKPKGYDWLVYSYGDPEGGKQKCTP